MTHIFFFFLHNLTSELDVKGINDLNSQVARNEERGCSLNDGLNNEALHFNCFHSVGLRL